MSKERFESPTGLRRMRTWVIVVAVFVVAAIASAAAAAIRGGRSPEPNEQANVGPSAQPTPSDTATPTGSPEPSSTPSASPAPSAAPGAGQPASAPKPMITSVATTADGLMVTVSFTLVAQPDRGPFTCSIRRGGSAGIEEFPCDIGQVSRTYNYTFCCGSSIYIHATDRFGVTSDRWDGYVDFPKPEQPTYSNLRGWHDGSMVHIAFDVTSAPGDDPLCRIYVSSFHGSQQWHDVPCTGSAEVSFPGPTGQYRVTITIKSDTYYGIPPMPPEEILNVA